MFMKQVAACAYADYVLAYTYQNQLSTGTFIKVLHQGNGSQ